MAVGRGASASGTASGCGRSAGRSSRRGGSAAGASPSAATTGCSPSSSSSIGRPRTTRGPTRAGPAGQYSDYAGAEQATMAIGSVLNFLAKRGELAKVRAANAALDRLHAEVRNDERFRPEGFRAALAQLGKTVR